MTNSHCIYWIRLNDHTDPRTQGYIGVSKDVEKRWKQHNRSPNLHLKRAFEKYGVGSVGIEVLKDGVDEELAFLIENQYRPTGKIGWNIVEGGGTPPSSRGRKASPEELEKMSKRWRGKKSPSYRPCNIYLAATNELIAHDVCLTSWCKENGVAQSNLQKTTKRTGIHVNGYYAEYIGHPRVVFVKRQQKYKTRKVVCNETGQVFDSVKDAAAWSGLRRTTVSRQIAGKVSRAYSKYSFSDSELTTLLAARI